MTSATESMKDFISRSIEKGTLFSPEFSNDTIKNVDNLSDSDIEENSLHHDMLIGLLIPGSVIAFYCATNARELLFWCKVFGVCHADADITDYYNHFVAKDTKSMKGYYLEKVSEKK